MEIIIKMDREEPVKVKTSSIYGELSPLPDWDPEYLQAELHKTKERYLQAEMDLQNHEEEIKDLNEQIQDLKLENDRLKQRDAKMIRALKSICCDFSNCNTCLFKEHNFNCESSTSDIAVAKITLRELEAL